ncbi:MAG: twin-arginine translocase TatA/TatE family subunit [Gemmatimonadetes bacterium]|jgi:sec-independent protein translocase protein TatA|nr:twin-arginine translocase TatA/TatE family subunit [Gemmatimonadota bacterium]MBP6668630.1 twin-arginine translocase TatA/TatE family subunit [Gemmatimonadales bacterium]MBK6779507.1 twin-arginine translocase TatA/TatE family subunit [Gemmatimonadota bacterium]MBK7350228.1 twin-arginine translocase TatA/TatE family subunit [Gemmatimonadota bacterium]MBK7716251.1 twin-arginine translocase TatA/TatE family subunit [Gemmatimonadota bacterium]
MFGNLGFPEILLVLVIVLLVFGAKRLPEIGSSFGKGIREFKRSISEASDAVTGSTDASSPTSRQIDSRTGPTPPAGGEPKRLSQ